MNPEVIKFNNEKKQNIANQGCDSELSELGLRFLVKSASYKYSYNFSWMGRPIIALPQDMIAMQEIIWEVKPDLIIETGVAHGGSIIYYASLLELLGLDGHVIGVDIEVRKHNKELIEAHPMKKRIHLIEGSSISESVFNEISLIAKDKKRIMVCLDSNHTHDHVLSELNLYAPLVSIGSYCVVFDTTVEDMPADYDWGSRAWGKGNNPKTAVNAYLESHEEFIIDEQIDEKLIISVAKGGFLKKIK